MPTVKMPNGDLVRFPDDMPKEQIRAMIASKFPDAAKTAAPESKGTARGTILPFEKNLDTGELSFAMPSLLSGIIDSGVSAVTAPARAMSGELQMVDPATGRTSPQAVQEGLNMATWATPSSPALGTSRLVSRAYEAANPAKNAPTIEAAKRLGVNLPKAIASESAVMNETGKRLSQVPLIGSPLVKASKRAIEGLDDAATKVQQSLGAGDKTVAGNALRTGIESHSKNILGGKIATMEDDLAKTIDPAKLTPLSRTSQVVQDIVKVRNDAALPGTGKAANLVEEAINRDGLTFDGIRTLRRSIREMLDNPSLIPADISQSELKRIYTSLTDDLKSAAMNSGGKDAALKFEATTRAEFNIAREREALQKVMGRNISDEGLVDRVISMAGDKSTANLSSLLKVRNAVSKETWNEVSSAALAKMGRDAEGNLTPDRLVTAWGKLTPAGRKILFADEQARQSIDDLVKVSSRFKKLNEYANPSGTAAQGFFSGGAAVAAWNAPLSTMTTAATGYGLSIMLSRPATAKAAANYAKALEMHAAKPSQTTQAMLRERAKNLALVIANDAGKPELAGPLSLKLVSPQKAAADQNNGNPIGVIPSQDQGGQADKAFNDAYLQGRAS